MREIIFDTETTGLDWSGDDRIIELGAVEVENFLPTGRTFQTYVNPGRPVSPDTVRITGITDDDLRDQPTFSHPTVVDAFLEFVGDARLVAHNASFDRGFLNAELGRLGIPAIPEDRWIDTAGMAREKFPGSPASLDALCKRFNIGLESRNFHGALLDSQLLAEVYLELNGGRARALDFGESSARDASGKPHPRASYGPRQRPLTPRLTPDESAAHNAFVEGLGATPLWKRYN